MVAVLEEGFLVVRLAGFQATVEDAEHLETEFATARGHQVAALFLICRILPCTGRFPDTGGSVPVTT